MSQPFHKWSEDKLDRVKRMKSQDVDKYAEEAIAELNDSGLGRKFWKSLEDEEDIFNPQNQAKALRAYKKAQARKRKRLK